MGCAVGSSPHTRGALRQQHLPRPGGGIIPAYAGSTRALNPGGVFSADHPRIRGEHSTYKIGTLKATGSSPHTRGAHHGSPSRSTWSRIIPAYAGSTRSAACRTPSRSDHPRIRGEHEIFSEYSIIGSGSSPHTRGALSPTGGIRVAWGIIPAYAGSTPTWPSSSETTPDHPRIRGEHLPRNRRKRPLRGSSPHTRGALPLDQAGLFEPRIIPAYAGSTARRPLLWGARGDHPRIRGEHTWKSLQYQGSPP